MTDPLSSNFELPLQLPFLKMENTSSVRDFIDSLSDLIDRNVVPKNRLPVLWSVDLGYISDGVEENPCAFVYSPALMGRKLNVKNKDDLLYIMNNAIEQWNSKYEKQYKTDAEMPSPYFVSSWREICDEWDLSAQDLYDTWLAKRVKTRLNTHIDMDTVVSSSKKI